MSKAAISERLKNSILLRPSERAYRPNAAPDMKVFRDEDVVAGKFGKHAPDGQRMASGVLGKQLSARLSGLRPLRNLRPRGANAAAQDKRQRVVVTIFYQAHGGAAGVKLIAHGKYLERDGSGADGEPGQFYDREEDKAEAYPKLETWAEEDKRHVRIMLAPESGARIEDLKDFTRAIMKQMERDLGMPLDWVAVNHHNTDNPHVHVILRGRRRDGPDLVIPRDYATWGLRHAAREIATQMLGDRGREDERLSLDRETRAERMTRLDRILETEINPDRTQRIQEIGRRLEPTMRAALRNRVRELTRMGLAREEKRDRFRFDPDWTARLDAIGRGMDIRKRLGRELEPGKGKLILYEPTMGRITGPVLEAGRRGEKGKGYLIVKDKFSRPVLANVRQRDVDGLKPDAIIAIEPTTHAGTGTRLKVDRLSELPIQSQIEARAETELDREIVQILAGEPQRLPSTREVRNAVSSRIAWHQKEGHGQRDLMGRFEFQPDALKALRGEELTNAENDLRRASGKGLINAADGLEREWRVRGLVQLHQGRFAQLERNDAVALVRLTRSLTLKQGKSYSISVVGGKMKATPSIGLER